MISVEKTNDYRPYVEKAFEDNKFLETYKAMHNLMSYDDCVNYELDLYNTMPEFDFNIIKSNNNFIGYFGSAKECDSKYLTTFYIDRLFRNKDFYNQFLDIIHNDLGNTFLVYRDNGNIKAENFIKNLGGNLILNKDEYRLYILNRSI